MQIRSDFSQRVVVLPGDVEWTASPSGGVKRKMLDRVGGEVARATSIVHFEAGAKFSEHEHGGGEEFLVLEGTFSDETGDFLAGSYVRNPIDSKHTPHSVNGCTIFVKLHQFALDDTEHKHINTKAEQFSPGSAPGLSVLPLHSHGAEGCALVRWEPGTRFNAHRHWGGEEILVLEGTFQDENGDYPAGSWLRSPHLSHHTPYSDDGCLIYVKTGHLADQQTV